MHNAKFNQTKFSILKVRVSVRQICRRLQTKPREIYKSYLNENQEIFKYLSI